MAASGRCRKIVQGEKFCEDGDAIISLGIPIGNGFDATRYFASKYVTLKEAMARWRVSHHSPQGRAKLVSAFTLGKVRYELNSMLPPSTFTTALTQDIERLIWANNPDLDTSKIGSTRAHKPLMHRQAARLPTREGGIRMPDINSHITAFQAQWGRRYLDPSTKPWKKVIDHYIADNHQEGRGILLSAVNTDIIINRLPKGAHYMKNALREFIKLNLQIRELADPPSPAVAAEPLWVNPRFQIKGIPANVIHNQWRGTLETFRITDLIGDDGARYTAQDWSAFYCAMSPLDKDGRRPSQEAANWRMKESTIIYKAVPPAILAAAAKVTPIKPGDVVSVASDRDPVRFARLKHTHSGAAILEELWLDASARAHLTGKTISIVNKVIETAALWGSEKTIGAQRWAMRIAGAMREVYPSDTGWTIPTQKERKQTALSALTIKNVTEILSRMTTRPPNSGPKWNTKLGITLDWNKIVWPNVGTTFTNMTHEKTWFKLAHRGLNVKNHHRSLDPSKRKCRMCDRANETMEHIITCGRARPLWLNIHALLEEMGEPNLRDTTTTEILITLITNTTIWGKPASESARATWRIALRQHYAAIVRIETENKTYNWQEVYLHTLQSLRTVATDYGERVKLKAERSSLTSKPWLPGHKQRIKAVPLLWIEVDGSYSVDNKIQDHTTRITAAIAAKRSRTNRNTLGVRALPPRPFPPNTG